METLCRPTAVSNDEILAVVLKILDREDLESLREQMETLMEIWDYTTEMIPNLTIGIVLKPSMFPDSKSYLKRYLDFIGEDASMLHIGDLITTLKDSEDLYSMIPYHIDRIIEASTPLSYDNAQKLLDDFVESQEQQDKKSISYDLVVNYLQIRMNEGITAPVPDHVIDNKLGDIPSTYPVLTQESILTMTMPRYVQLMKGTPDGDKNIEILESLPYAERKERLSQIKYIDPEVLQTLLDSKDLIRIFGPVNPSVDYDFSEIDDRNMYGGERMLLDNTYDTDDFSDEWFTGVCVYCKKNIKSRRFACRIPVPQGGWKGCYCSWDHVKRDILDAQEQKDPETEEYGEKVVTELQIALVNTTIKEILKVGVFAVVNADDIPIKAPEQSGKGKKKEKTSTMSKVGKVFKEISPED